MIYGYARVSTLTQIRHDRTTMEDQERVIQSIALIRGVTEVVMFRDDGVSGSVPLAHRPGGSELLEKLQPGDMVISSKLDRMFRSARDALEMVDKLKARGVSVVLANISTDPVNDRGSGGLFFKIMAAVADFERDMILERTAAGRAGKKARGGHIGGDAPYGYRKVGSGTTAMLEGHPDEQQTIGAMKRMKASGMSLHSIAKQLNSIGILAREGQWIAKQVSRALDRV